MTICDGCHYQLNSKEMCIFLNIGRHHELELIKDALANHKCGFFIEQRDERATKEIDVAIEREVKVNAEEILDSLIEDYAEPQGQSDTDDSLNKEKELKKKNKDRKKKLSKHIKKMTDLSRRKFGSMEDLIILRRLTRKIK